MDKPKKKWVSSRLKDKKKELGIVEEVNDSPSPSTEEKKVRKVNKPKKNFSDKKSSYKKSSKRGSYKKGSKKFSKKGSNRRYDRNRKKYVIKISNLPNDITVRELAELVGEWGEIGNINIKNYYDSVSSYIDFYNEEESQYFIKALDSTPFDNLIMRVELMDFS